MCRYANVSKYESERDKRIKYMSEKKMKENANQEESVYLEIRNILKIVLETKRYELVTKIGSKIVPIFFKEKKDQISR